MAYAINKKLHILYSFIRYLFTHVLYHQSSACLEATRVQTPQKISQKAIYGNLSKNLHSSKKIDYFQSLLISSTVNSPSLSASPAASRT